MQTRLVALAAIFLLACTSDNKQAPLDLSDGSVDLARSGNTDLLAPTTDLSSSSDFATSDATTTDTDLGDTGDLGELASDLLDTADFEIATTTTTAEVSAAGSVSVTVDLTRLLGRADAVTLEISGLPASVTPDDVTKVLLEGTSSATFVLSAAVNATESGPHTITIKGTSGSYEHSITFQLVVHEPADFTLEVDPLIIGFIGNQSKDLSVTVGRGGGFSANVLVELIGLPTEISGASRTFTAADTTAKTMSLTAQEVFSSSGGTFTVRGTSGAVMHEVSVQWILNASPDFDFSLESPTKSVSRTTSGTLEINVTRINSYAGQVDVTVSGLPSGVTVTPAPLVFAPGATSGTLTFNASNSATLGGPVAVTIAAASSPNGVLKVKNKTLDLTVTAAPSFTLSAANTASVAQGASSNFTLTAVRDGGYTNALTTNVLSLPTGVTATGGTFGVSVTTAMVTLSALANALLLVPTEVSVSTTDGTVTQTKAMTVTVTPKADVQLDTTFGTNGAMVLTDLLPYQRPLTARATASYAVVATTLGVMHILPNGTFDATYAPGGSFTGVADHGLLRTPDVATVASNGDVYFGTVGGNNTVYVSKILANGTADMGFGASGVASFSFTGMNDELNGIAVRGDGLVYAYGATTIGSKPDFAVARLTTAGVLDTSFSTDGMSEIDFGQSDRVMGVVFGASNTALVIGEARTGGTVSIALARLTNGGALDTTYSGDGLDTLLNQSSNGVEVVTELASGKIMIGGYANSGPAASFQLTRLTAAGAVDTSFDGDGFAVLPAVTGPTSMVEDSSNRLLLTSIHNSTYSLRRYTAAGAIDSTFSDNGVDELVGGTGDFEFSQAVTVDPVSGAYWTFGALGPRIAGARFLP